MLNEIQLTPSSAVVSDNSIHSFLWCVLLFVCLSFYCHIDKMFGSSFVLSTLFALPGALGAAAASGYSSRDAACVNSPSTRSCWSDGFDISTNWYEAVPDTGVTREYWFNIENGTASPDGVEIPVQTINGSIPGPTIIADWGDWVGKHCLYQVFPRQETNRKFNSRARHELTPG